MTPTPQNLPVGNLPVDNLPVAVVTGGARGIGLAIGQWFLANSYRIALIDIDEATLAKTAAALHSPGKVLCLSCDVSDEAACAAIFLGDRRATKRSPAR